MNDILYLFRYIERGRQLKGTSLVCGWKFHVSKTGDKRQQVTHHTLKDSCRILLSYCCFAFHSAELEKILFLESATSGMNWKKFGENIYQIWQYSVSCWNCHVCLSLTTQRKRERGSGFKVVKKIGHHIVQI